VVTVAGAGVNPRYMAKKKKSRLCDVAGAMLLYKG